MDRDDGTVAISMTTWRARRELVGRHARPQWPRLTGILCLTILQSILVVAQPWPLKMLADYALGQTPEPAAMTRAFQFFGLSAEPSTLIWVAAALTLILTLATLAIANLLTWLWESAGQRMVYDLAARMYAHLQLLSLSFHTRQPVGDTLTRLNSDSWSIYSATNVLLIAPMSNGLTLVSVAFAAWLLSPGLAIVAFITAPIMAVTAAVIGARIKGRSTELRIARGRMTAYVQQTMGALPLIHAYGTQNRSGAELERHTDQVTESAVRQALTDRSFQISTGLIGAIGAAVIVFVGARMVIQGSMTVGTLLVFLAYLRTLDLRMRALLTLYAGFRAAEAGLDRVLEVVGRESDVRDPENPRSLPHRSAGDGRTVRFEGVEFEYERGVPVLRDIWLESGPGQKTALVGRSGSGKSTLVSLIVRTYDPIAGRVLIDEVDVRELRLVELRQQVAVVSQDPLLLPISVAMNIAYGRPGATRAEIEAAARAANADEFIQSLPEGYETVLAERGATLSGGQRQRLAIARAVLKDAPIVVLDEPTSALDTATEHSVIEALSRLLERRTTFLIAHRLSTIRDADQVVVLENGTIVNQTVPGDLQASSARSSQQLAPASHDGTGEA